MSRPVLELRGVRREVSAGAFRAKRVLHAVNGVSLTVSKGEILGLVSESGCGKSTLASLMLGLLPVTDGEIIFEGKPVAALRDADLRAHSAPSTGDRRWFRRVPSLR